LKFNLPGEFFCPVCKKNYRPSAHGFGGALQFIANSGVLIVGIAFA
jgi:hypothetical protein